MGNAGLDLSNVVQLWMLYVIIFGFGMALDMFTSAEPWPVVAAAAEAGLATIGPPQPSDSRLCEPVSTYPCWKLSASATALSIALDLLIVS